MGVYGTNLIQCAICDCWIDEDYGEYDLHPDTLEPVCLRCWEALELDSRKEDWDKCG